MTNPNLLETLRPIFVDRTVSPAEIVRRAFAVEAIDHFGLDPDDVSGAGVDAVRTIAVLYAHDSRDTATAVVRWEITGWVLSPVGKKRATVEVSGSLWSKAMDDAVSAALSA